MEKEVMITNVHNTYRKATSVEVRFYEEVLYPAQDLILSLCREYKYLYLTGGTALARFYLNHRLSEDLDFFIQVLDEDTDEVIEQQKKAEHYADDLAGKISRYFPVFARRSGDLYSKFYVKLEGFDLKIDFVREYNHTGNLLPLKSGGLLNNLDDLGTGKLMAFEDRSEIKDIIDLYYITQQIPLSRLFELAELKRIPIAYEKLLAINTQGISGKVLITQDLDPTALKNFIVLLKQETETVIKKKEDFAAKHINELISRQLWDFPREDRNLNPYSIPVLKRRLYQLPLPEKRALSAILY